MVGKENWVQWLIRKLGLMVGKKIGFSGWPENWFQWLARKLGSVVDKKIGFNS